jgi:hypothetical protein
VLSLYVSIYGFTKALLTKFREFQGKFKYKLQIYRHCEYTVRMLVLGVLIS